jgi:hypothetical protein
MLSLNWQRTFDGAAPRLVRPTLASGEHGAPVQGLGLVVEETSPAQITVQSWTLVVAGVCFLHTRHRIKSHQGRKRITQDEVLGALAAPGCASNPHDICQPFALTKDTIGRR